MPEGTLEGASPELPPRFYCEICRIKRADPYVMPISLLILQVVCS